MHTKEDLLQRRVELSAAKLALLEKRRRREPTYGARPDSIQRRLQDNPAPISFAQQRLWFLQQLEPESTVYNELIVSRLKGQLIVPALTQAAREIIRRHEVLRGTYTTVDGQVIQVINPASHADLTLPFIDLREVPPVEREGKAQCIMAQEAQHPFYLSEEMPWRMNLLRLDEEEHIILVIMHHIVTDAWSMEVFVRELTALYAAFCAGQPSPLPELPLQYADYACWQRQWLEKGGLDEQLEYWKQRLGGTLPVLELPTDHPRGSVSTHRGSKRSFLLSRSLSQELQALSRQEGVTLFMTLLAAFNVLLSRYSQQEDLLVGSPIANRTRAELEGLLGCFVNTLVLRSDLSGQPSFRELLKRMREVTLGAYDHQDVPFEKLVEELQPARSLSHSPLFQVMFVLQNVPLGAQDLPGLAVSRVEVERGTAKFDVSLCLQETAQGLSGFIEYNSDLFEASTIERMLGHFERLLQSVVTDPGQRLANLALLTDAELEQVLVNWNATRTVYPQEQCLHELIEAQAARTPDAIAVIFEQEQLTYRELNQRANQLAYYLGTLGVKPEFLVGICMERSLELVVGLLGILKAGGAYVPLDPTYPQERLGFLLQDAQVSILLTQEQLQTRLPEHSARIICVDADWRRIAQEPVENPSGGTTLDNLAYMIYTSGSTGKPKGAMNTHRGICNRLLWMQEAYQLQETDRVLQKTPFSFDVSVWEFFWPLLTGAQLIIARPGGHRDSAYLIELIVEQQVTTLHFVPSMLRIFLEEPGVARCRSLRHVICSGEALPFDLQNSFFERLGASLHNLYGPTEASVDVTYWTCERESPRQVVPIGYPIANTQIYLLDAHLNPVPVGVPGELHIGGIGLGRGYFRRPELTAEKFIPNPFSDEPGARLYKTGDLARYLPGGIIEYLGRNDHQVKIRGYRIELGEIEAVLGTHPAVRECVVIAREDEQGDRRLVAYIVGHREQNVSPEELQHFLRERLPDHMVPSAFVSLVDLPLSPNGKLDRSALPAPDSARPTLDAPFVVPRDLIEEMLADIWSDVLGVERVGVHDDFFALGGHSLLATRVISRIRNAFGVELPLLTLFESPTVADLARHLKAAQQVRQGVRLPPLVPASREGDFPLSFTQQRLWFFDQLEPANSVYNIFGAVRLSGPLRVKTVEQCLNEVVRRHEILRTTFAMIDGQPIQVIAPALSVSLHIKDLQELSGPDQEAEVMRLAIWEMQQPFDLAHGPLFRVTLLRLAEEEYTLLLTAHHIISDGWSTSVFVRELTALYAAFVNGRPSPLPELPVQYADYAIWQREWLQGEVLETQLAYWKRQLADLPVLQLPTDYPRPAIQSFRGANQQVVLPKPLTEALKVLSRQEGVTLFMTLLAAYQTLLLCYTDQTNIAVGIPIAGRTESKLEGLIGCFINTLALRTDLSGNPTFHDLLGRVREVALGAYAHQDLPFEKLVEELQPERDLSRSPVFQVMFAFQNVPRGQVNLPDVTLTPLRIDSEPALFDLDMTLWESEDEIVGVLNYNLDLFNAVTIKRLRDHFQRVLESVAVDPGQRLLDLPLLSEEERQQVLVDWNATEAPFPAEQSMVELFEAQVARSPAAVAVVYENEQQTYRQLQQQVHRLACSLHERGVGPETLVALLAERSPAFLSSMLAVFQLGAAYLPLDPQHPVARLRQVLGHSGCRLVLVSQALLPLLTQVLEELPQQERPAVLCLEEVLQEPQAQQQPLPRPSYHGQQLAYVIYTSGSTGLPKGVMVEQAGMLNHLWAKIAALDLSETDRVAQTASPCFDISVWQLLAALLVGGCVHIVPDEVAHDPRRLLELLEREQLSILETVPSLLRIVLEVLEAASERGQKPELERLRWLIPTGEALAAGLCRRWLALYPQVPLLNAYGPTECSDDVTHQLIRQVREQEGASMPIGRPLANLRLYVLDGQLEPVPVGVRGEVYVGGVGVGRGYVGEPERTAQSYVPDAFGGPAGGRLYRTGDVGRYREDGVLEYLGRLDQQVKLRGNRIELEEIEAVLERHAGVRQCVVLLREEVAGHQRLVAYVVPEGQEGQEPGSQALWQYAREQLPAYMVPAALVFLEALPLTANGKVDRRALPAPSESRAMQQEAYVAPRTPLEEQLAGIWSQLLGLERISIHDNFFEVGGHSLLITQVVARIRDTFQVELPLRTFFKAPTIAELAEAIAKMKARSDELRKPSVAPVSREAYRFKRSYLVKSAGSSRMKTEG